MASAAFTTRRTAFTPSWCPATRGRPRRVAQRPLPSMMMATCSGTVWASTTSRSSSSLGIWAGETWVDLSDMDRVHRSLEGEDFLLLFLEELVHLGDELVGRLLDLVVASSLLVFGHLLVLGQPLELVVGLPAQVAYGHAGFLGDLADRLGELLATFLGQGGHAEAQLLS